MRSRSYFGIAGSSFLLLFASACLVETVDEGKERKERPSAPEMPPEDPTFLAPTEARPPEEPLQLGEGPLPISGDDGCLEGQMPFEGQCTDKKEVERVLEVRAKRAKKKMKKARGVKEKAKAVNDMLEQQIQQVDKAEDDLDEIIDQLEREREEKKY